MAPDIPTKSGLMVGLGERWEELVQVLTDLRSAGVEIITIGQYLRPSLANLPMERYYTPSEFAELKRIGLELGFGHVESGPLVRSSYHAHEQTQALENCRS
jgi:lipoic acid synthetase